MKTLNEYDKYDERILNENFNELKSRIDQIGQAKNGFGLLSSDLCTIYGSVSMRKMSSTCCDILIKAKIETRSENLTTDTMVPMFDLGKILAMVGLKSINFDPRQTILSIDQRGMTSGLVELHQTGYGLGVRCLNGVMQLGRIYQNSGGFAPYAGNSSYYTPKSVYYISIFSAQYT